MIIFGYRIQISKLRFFGSIGALILLIILATTFWPSSKSNKPNLLYQPAFSPYTLPKLSGDWLGPRISSQGLLKPIALSQFTGSNFVTSVGLPMQLEVYVPSVDTSSGATTQDPFPLTSQGYTFEQAVFIAPTQATSVTNLEDEAQGAGPFVVVGFPSGQLPSPGVAYSVTAMLWWRSDELYHFQTGSYPGTPPYAAFLATTHDALDPAQLNAPATQSVDLGLSYSENGQRLTINKVEWAAGQELRLEITLTNLTTHSIPAWIGTSTSTASVGSANETSVIDPSDPNDPLALNSELQVQQSITGYITFGASVADPTKPLTLRLPSLSASAEQDLIVINLHPNQETQLISAS